MSTDTPAAEPARHPGRPGSATDLKSAPLAEVENQLGYSSDGLSAADAAKRLQQYGPNEIAEQKTQPVAEVPELLLGSDPVDDRDRRDLVGRGRALAGFLHHPGAARGQRRGRVHRGTPGRQRHRRAEGQAGDQRPRHARRRVDYHSGARAGAR